MLFFGGSLNAPDATPLERPQKTALRGLSFLLERDYLQADSLHQELVRTEPRDLLGYLGLISSSQLRNLENYDFRFEAGYDRWSDAARELALSLLNNPTASSWDLLLAGGVLGITGFQKAHHNRWFSALRDGQLAMQALQNARRRDPGFIDPWLGLGLYDYWRSYYTRQLKFLSFFPDRRREGKERILRVMKEGKFVGPIAAASLGFIELNEKNYPAVLKVTQEFLNRYPENIIIRMLEGEAYLGLKKYPEAIQNFVKILRNDPSITKCYLFLGLAYAAQPGETERARNYLQLFLKIEKEAPRHLRNPAELAFEKLQH